MKIVLWPTNSFPNIGGLETMTHTLAKQLLKEGHDVIVLGNDIQSGAFREIVIEDVKIYLFPFIKALCDNDLVLVKNVLKRIHELFDGFAPNLVNVHGWFECFSFYQTRVLEKRATPICLTIHGLLEQKHYGTPSCVKLWSMLSAVNVVSRGLLPPLKAAGFEHSKLRVIQNGLPAYPKPLAPLETDSPRLLMIGRLSSEKGFDVGLHAFKELRKKRPDSRLTLVGGGNFSELAELKTRLELDEYVDMTDFVLPERVPDYIDAANLLIVPSTYESFSLVALEAALRGRPAVASQIPGLNETVADNETGVLVPPGDPYAFAAAVDRIFSNPMHMQVMGKNAYERASSMFGIETTAKQYLNMYLEALEVSSCKRLSV